VPTWLVADRGITIGDKEVLRALCDEAADRVVAGADRPVVHQSERKGRLTVLTTSVRPRQCARPLGQPTGAEGCERDELAVKGQRARRLPPCRQLGVERE